MNARNEASGLSDYDQANESLTLLQSHPLKFPLETVSREMAVSYVLAASNTESAFAHE